MGRSVYSDKVAEVAVSVLSVTYDSYLYFHETDVTQLANMKHWPGVINDRPNNLFKK